MGRPELLVLAVLLLAAFADHKIGTFPKNVVPPPGNTMRIFGGTAADDGQFPYMIFVLYRSNNQMSSCSASLVAEDKVLLAAHCFVGDADPRPSNAIAVAGKADLAKYIAEKRKDFGRAVDEVRLGLQERRGAQVTISPSFTGMTDLQHDVAVLTVERKFQLNNNVALIPIASGTITQRTTCTIQGWGLSEEDRRSYRLMYVKNAHALPVQDCQYKKKNSPFFCLQPTRTGICQGDSGSPVVCKGLVYGVASHVITERTQAECGDDLEEVFASLDEEDWLLQLLSTPSQPAPGTDEKKDTGSGSQELQIAFSVLVAMTVLHVIFLAIF